MVEHNEVPEAHSAMTLDERMVLARQAIMEQWAQVQVQSPQTAFPTDVSELDESQRRTAKECLHLEASAFADRMKLVLLPEEVYTRLMSILQTVREEARKKNREPQFNLKQLEGLAKTVSHEACGDFLASVQQGVAKLKDAAAFGKTWLMKDRTSLFTLCLCFVCFHRWISTGGCFLCFHGCFL